MRHALPEGFATRAATVADAAAVAACVAAAYTKYIARNGLVPGPMRDDYEEIIARHDVTVIMAGDAVMGEAAPGDAEPGEAAPGDVVAGALVLMKKDEGFLLDNIAVLPAHQGKGLGRYLLELAEDKALELGYDSIYLYAQDIMTENRALYERIGYVEYARRKELGLNRVYLRKPLAPAPS